MTIYNREDYRAVLPQLEKQIDELQSRIQELETTLEERTEQDYIVEQGTEGIWTYRKWNSGIAECWGKLTRSSSLASNAHANLTSALPTFFVNEEPIITGSGGGTGQPNAFMAYVNLYGSSGAYGIDAYVRNNGSSAAASQWLRFYVIGKWK